MTTYKWGNITIIGTSHISIESVNEVKRFVVEEKPDIIALELDPLRFESILSPEKRKVSISDIKHIGLNGFLFNIFGGWIQKKLGDVVGVDPGSEMLASINLAKENNLTLVLVDQDIRITLKRLSGITFKEKFRIFWDVIRSPFVKRIEGFDVKTFDLKKVPEEKLIILVLGLLKKRYPSFHRVLIEERNIIIAKNLNNVTKNNPGKKILAVLGAGHIPGLTQIIKSGEY